MTYQNLKINQTGPFTCSRDQSLEFLPFGVSTFKGHDGDTFGYVYSTDGAPQMRTIMLVTQPGMYWKGVSLVDQVTGDIIDGIEVDKGPGSAQMHYGGGQGLPGDTAHPMWMVFWKAKTFGNHYPMYVCDAGAIVSPGQSVMFTWVKD